MCWYIWKLAQTALKGLSLGFSHFTYLGIQVMKVTQMTFELLKKRHTSQFITASFVETVECSLQSIFLLGSSPRWKIRTNLYFYFFLSIFCDLIFTALKCDLLKNKPQIILSKLREIRKINSLVQKSLTIKVPVYFEGWIYGQ